MTGEKKTIANYLDLLFKGKNKSYGAYELRSKYSFRLVIGLLISSSIPLCAFFLLVYYKKSSKPKEGKKFKITEVILQDVNPEATRRVYVPPLEAAKKKKAPAPKKAAKKFTPPKVVADTKVNVKEEPPKQKEIKTHEIAAQEKKDDIEPSSLTEGGAEDGHSPEGLDQGNATLVRVEISASYPGNWREFISENIDYPSFAQEEGIEGSVRIQFVVDLDGRVSNVQSLSGPKELREEAERVIRKSGKWIPAMKNGTKVKSYKIQIITFKLDK